MGGRTDDAAPFDALARGVRGVAEVYRAVLADERGHERGKLTCASGNSQPANCGAAITASPGAIAAMMSA
jgi:hypothetical protein